MKTLLDAISRLIGFRLTPKGVGLLLVGCIVGFGIDNFINAKSDYRLSIFIIGCSIIFTYILNAVWKRIRLYHSTKKAVKKLTPQECLFALNCDKGGQFVKYNLSNSFQIFQLKWKYILYVPTPQYLVTDENYEICTNNKAIKLIRKKTQKKAC